MNWQRVLKWLAQVGGGIAVIATLLGAIIYVIHAETADLRSDVLSLKGQVQDLRTDLGKANSRVDDLLSDALRRAFPTVGKGAKASNESLKQGAEVLALARTVNAKLDAATVAEYGKRVALLARERTEVPVAWTTLAHALNYRSFLNADFLPKDRTPTPPNSKYKFSVNTIPDPSVEPPRHLAFVVSQVGGYVPMRDSARLEGLTDPPQEGSGIAFFVVDDGGDFVDLDGMYLKNVIVRNAKILYHGAAVKLENVYFVNCSFTLFKNTSTLDFTQAVLQAAATNFSNALSPS